MPSFGMVVCCAAPTFFADRARGCDLFPVVVDRLDHIFVLLFKAIMAIIDSCLNSFSDDFCIDALQSFELLLKIIDCLSKRYNLLFHFGVVTGWRR